MANSKLSRRVVKPEEDESLMPTRERKVRISSLRATGSTLTLRLTLMERPAAAGVAVELPPMKAALPMPMMPWVASASTPDILRPEKAVEPSQLSVPAMVS